jgi:transcription elongation factor Elf1
MTHITVQEHICPHCGAEMELVYQEQRNAEPLPVVTCKSKTCDMWSVTLSIDVYNGLTTEQVDGYKQMVASLKERFGY